MGDTPRDPRLPPGGHALSLGPHGLYDTWSNRWGTDWAPMADRDVDLANLLVAVMDHPARAHGSDNLELGTYPYYTVVAGSPHVWCAACGEVVATNRAVAQDAIRWAPDLGAPGWSAW